MFTINCINGYKGEIINGGDSYLYIPPNISLRSYISHYCISFPNQEAMSDNYTVLPSANAVLCVSVNNSIINVHYNGTNTKATVVGVSANKNDMLLLIKFRAGGFAPFYGFNQNELINSSLELSYIDKGISYKIENAIEKSYKIDELVTMLDCIFLSHLRNNNNYYISDAIKLITSKNGNISSKELCEEIHYSERHIRRLFLKYVGTSPKTFSRIVRVNHVLQLLQKTPICFMDIALNSGFVDQPHLINDFKSVCGLTPKEYMKNMSDFYNNNYKL